VFSGIIEDLGTVHSLKPSEKGMLITLRTALPVARIKLGDSIAVNGACLTVIDKERGKDRGKELSMIAMEVSAETLRRTVLGKLNPGDRVNLERSLTLGTLLNGHLVSGHVGGVGKIVSIKPEGDSRLYVVEAPASEARYLVEKGSVAVDGISLTVFAIRGRRFTCAIIPHTLKMTTLGVKGVGSAVNIESDMLGKYVEKFLVERLGQNAASLQ
jgi:riboflavin synthase